MNDLKPNKDLLFKAIKSFRLFKTFKEMIKSFKVLHLRKKLMINAIKDSDADILISTRYFHNNLLSKYGSKKALKIAWEHNHHQGNKKYINKVVNSVKNINYLVLVSNELYNDYKTFIKGACKCVYIPNMIDIEKPNVSLYKDNFLVNVSRLSKEKGIFDLLDVVSIVKKEIPSIKLNLIGDGALYNDVKKYVQDSKLENNVILYGFKDADYVHKILSKSSLYVLTSYTESFGLSLLEAFSHKVPAIAFDSAQGACEIIKNGINGYLISKRDKNRMSEKIIEMLKNTEKITKLGQSAYDTYNKYKPENLVVLWKNILH